MSKAVIVLFVFLGLFGLSGGQTVLAQDYRCDWNVVGIGGGEIGSTAHRCAATVGQTGVGAMTSSGYHAFIGFWQIDVTIGVQEEARWSAGTALATRLFRPVPNPTRSQVLIRYTLDAERQTLLQIHDLSGRVVRTLVASGFKRGAYSVTWNGTDARGRALASGVYFLSFQAGDYRQTEKLLLQR